MRSLPPSTIRCDVAYANALNQAVRKAPAVMSQQFGVEDGRLLFVAGPISRMRRSPLRSGARQPLVSPNIRPRSRSPTSSDPSAPSSLAISRIGRHGTGLKKADPNYPASRNAATHPHRQTRSRRP